MQRTLLTIGLLTLLGASGLFIGADTAAADEHERMYEVGTAIEPLTLPEVTGGTPPFTYSLTPALPLGLTFDAATRTISGTPLAAAPATEYIYTVTDGANASVSVPLLTIEVKASEGPALGGLTYEVGTAIEPLTLPEVTGGGTPPFTYSLTPALPAGLMFDAATRTISGTPTEVAAAAEYTYVATDGANASLSLPPFSIEVVLPPLDAPDALRAEDYKGADGAGDQGGFLLLTWDLSDDHDTLDGYRIFRKSTHVGRRNGSLGYGRCRTGRGAWSRHRRYARQCCHRMGHCRRARRPHHARCCR